MWVKRLSIAVIAMMLCNGVALFVGQGTAAAFSFQEIIRAAEAVAPALAKRLGLAEQQVEPLLVSQASRLTPVRDAAELGQFQREWATFTPRRPARDEVVVVREDAPSTFKTARNMLCETAVDLVLGDEDMTSWSYTLGRVDAQIQQSYPLGRRLAVYNDLNGIARSFQNGCICRATAKLAVFVTKTTYCG